MKQFVLKTDQEPSSEESTEFLNGLNEQQRLAAAHTHGPILIIAGAGSGKTRVLTFRIANLLAKKVAFPEQIMALTFTNKAAREMQDRIARLIGDEAKRLWMGTFHSVFSKILRFEADKLGFTSSFSIYDSEDTQRAIKNVMSDLHINTTEVKPKDIYHIISKAKNNLITPQQFAEKHASSSTHDLAAQIYPRYQALLKKSNAFDFDDLLVQPIRLFEENPDILEKYQNKFRFLLIDEYQDTNHAQYKVTKLLASKYKNICVVGDDAQSIYSFRGADIGNILDFQKDYPEALKVPLEQNYRSTKAILRCADSVIKKNSKQLDKNLWTDNDAGSMVTLLESASDRDEARKVVSYLHHLKLQRRLENKDFAILYRTNFQSRLFEDALRASNISYQIVGGISFYQRKEVKDVLSYLTLLVNENNEEALLRVINEPGRGVGTKSIEILRQEADFRGVTIWNVIQNIQTVTLYGPAKKSIDAFVKVVESAKARVGSEPIYETAQFLLEKSGYMKMYSETSDENLDRKGNIMALLDAIAEYEETREEPSLDGFLQEVSLITDMDEKDMSTNKVTMMSIHASKGLEFPAVFVVGLEEELFPIGGRNGSDVNIEEERRLFYVAITRAEKLLFLSHAKNRFRFGTETRTVRSRFIDDLDEKVVVTENGTPISKKSSWSDSTFSDSFHEEHDWRKPLNENRKAIAAANESTRVHYEPESTDDFQVGGYVFHAKFGEGKIQHKEGKGIDTKLTIFFTNAGQKRLILKFAKLSILR